jgi:hypothetical protein
MSVAVPLAAAVAAFLSYRLFDTWTRPSWLPAALRALGWGSLALLLVNASCPAGPAGARPIVLLDGSLSMGAAAGGGRWGEARALARGLGETRTIGGGPGDTVPTGGESRLAPAVRAAAATGRPVILITDGEVDDAETILADPFVPEIRVLPRPAAADLALTRVDGPRRLAAGDTLRLTLELAAWGAAAVPGRRVALQVRDGTRLWARGAAELDSGGRARVILQAPVPAVSAGPHALSIGIVEAADAEPRTDSRLWVIQVVPTPGVVLLASPPSWESRFLLSTLRDVAAVPVRGYLETEPGTWRRAGDLQPVSLAEVAEAARRADLLVTLGPVAEPVRTTRARARWTWIRPAETLAGDWYVVSSPTSPLGAALAGLPVDSFPPGVAIAELTTGPDDWVGLAAQLGRRGTSRPVLVGRDSAGVRRVVTGIDGLWRWAFRGGSSEQGYRGIVAATASWLLGGTDSVSGRARLRREVVSQGLPAVFDWVAGGNPGPLGVVLVRDGETRRDTLRFDGAGRAELRVPPGVWRFRVEGGGEGLLGVEEYSEELLPRPRTLENRLAAVRAGGERRPVREGIWLFALAAAAFACEWTARRRRGLR